MKLGLRSNSGVPIVGLGTIFSFARLAHEFVILHGFAQGSDDMLLAVCPRERTLALNSRTSSKLADHLIDNPRLVMVTTDSAVLYGEFESSVNPSLKLLTFSYLGATPCHWFYLRWLSRFSRNFITDTRNPARAKMNAMMYHSLLVAQEAERIVAGTTRIIGMRRMIFFKVLLPSALGLIPSKRRVWLRAILAYQDTKVKKRQAPLLKRIL